MAGSVHFSLVSAPFEDDSDGDGIPNARRAYPGSGGQSDTIAKVDLGDVAARIVGFKPNLVRVPIIRGSDRVYRTNVDELRLELPLDELDGEQLAQIRNLYVLGRPVAFTPWYDYSTWWMSTFGDVEQDAGCAEIGLNEASGIGRRSTGDYVPSRWSGSDGWIVNNADLIKRTVGMIGNAVLIESARANLAPASPTWYASDAAKITVTTTDLSNNDLTQGIVCSLITGGPSGGSANCDLTGFTAGTTYTISLWTRGTGTVTMRFADDGGGTTNASYDLDPTKWTRVFVTFTKATGTTGTIKFKPSVTGSISIHTALQVEASGTFGSYLDPSVTAPTTCDKIFINEALGRGGDLTVAAWSQRFPLTVSGRRYLFSAYDSGAGNYFYAYIEGTSVKFSLLGVESTVGISGTSEGDWEQWVFVVRGDDGGYSGLAMQECWNNGTLLLRDTVTAPGTGAFSSFPTGFYVGSDLAFGSGQAFDAAIDRFRVDLRSWSQQEIEDDYATLYPEGIRGFLAQTQGRLFQFGAVPGRFLAGDFTDRMEGTVQLDQVSTVPAGIPL